MKLSINYIVTLLLFAVCLFFSTMWYMQGSDYKNKIRESDIKIQKIEKIRDSLKSINKKLEKDFICTKKLISERDKKIKIIERDLYSVKKKLVIANSQVDENKKNLEESKKRIKKLKENPIKREDEDLIKSLREKLKNN